MKRILILLLSVAFLSPLLASNVKKEDFPFVHINRSNSNISYDGISRIYQDSRGFLWVGTFKGLNRFDGDRFTVFDKDDFGVASDFIHSIEEDTDGNIWVGTDRGIVIYNYSLDTFTPFTTSSDIGTVIDNKVNNIKCVDGKVWITVNHQGMFSYDIKTGELVNYFVENEIQTLPQGIRRFIVDNNGDFWLGLYYTDLYKASPQLDSLHELSLGGSFKDDNVEGLALSSYDSHIIYVVAVKKGLCKIDAKQGTVTTLLSFPDDAVPLELCLDPGKCMWIPTTKGLYRYDMSDGSYIVLQEDKSNRFSLSDNYVFTVFVDNVGGVWAGTKDGGLNYSGPEQGDFKKYYQCGNHTLENSVVSGFADDERGGIWITTEKGGLFRYDVDKEKLTRYPGYDFKETICSPCFYGGYLWLGSLKGLIRLEPSTGRVRRYQSFANASVEDNRCLVVYRTDTGHLYIGTTLGLMRYDSGTDSFVALGDFEGKFITGIDEDGRGRMWVSTYADGVYHFDPSTEAVLSRYHCYDGLPTNKLSGVFVDGKDRVWAIGFSFGFYCFDKMTGSFTEYSTKNLPDLPSDVFFSAIDDRDGDLWLSSDVGIVRFDPETKAVSSYTTSVGLLDDVMKKGVAKDAKGNLYFGSQNGFVSFNPDKFHVSEFSPNLIITDFRIGDEVIKPGPGSPLNCNIDLVEEIHLTSGQNSFGLSASVVSLSTVANNKILCFLDGYDENPRILTGNRSICWYNVPPGSYRLLVRGSNVNGRWNIAHKPITIVIEQPLLATPGAIVIYVFIALVLSFVVAQLYSHRLKRRERERMEAFENEMQISVFSDTLPTVLLIADNVSVLQQVKQCIGQECNVVSAMTAKRAFMMLETLKVNLMIVDIDTRYFDGEDFCSRVLEVKDNVRIPIIILSLDATTKRKIAYMDKGVSLFIEKPFTGDYLKSAIRNVFNKEMSIESAISQSIVSMKIHRLKLDSKDEDFLNLLEKTVIDNLSDPSFGSAELEAAMAMSRSSLVRRMKALLDTTPNEYLKQKRLTIAARMLKENNVRVNEICYAVGFKYPSYFTKCFKEVYGLLPADYRKKWSKNT